MVKLMFESGEINIKCNRVAFEGCHVKRNKLHPIQHVTSHVNADTLSAVSDNRCGAQCNEAAGYTAAGDSKFGFFDCPIDGGDATTGLNCQGQI